jgi:hypothetical protein
MPTFVTGGTSGFGAITATAPRSKLMTALAAGHPPDHDLPQLEHRHRARGELDE